MKAPPGIFLLSGLFVALATGGAGQTASTVQGNAATPESTPAEAYVRSPALYQPRLSPDGSQVAIFVMNDEQQYDLRIGIPGTKADPRTVDTGGIPIVDFWWKSESLLILRLAPANRPTELATLDLSIGTLSILRSFTAPGQFISILPEDPDAILLGAATRPVRPGGNTAQVYEIYGHDLTRVNIHTGKTTVRRDPGTTTHWFVNSSGEPIAAWGTDGTDWVLRWPDGSKESWKELKQSPKSGVVSLRPFAVASDQRRLIALDYRRNPSGEVVTYDLATGSAEPLPELGDDFGSELRIEPWGRRGEIGSISWISNGASHRVFLNRDAETFYRSLQTALPGANFFPESFSEDGSRVVVRIESDQTAGEYVLVDRARSTLVRLGERFPGLGLPPSESRVFSFQTQDGRVFDGRIILPQGIKRPPLIVDVGEASPGTIDPTVLRMESEYFVSRGYAVATLGSPLAEWHDVESIPFKNGSAVRQVAAITSAINWLQGQGWIDGSKVAVMGQFRGGTDTLLRLTSLPNLQALVNFDSVLEGVMSPLGLPTFGSRSGFSPPGGQAQAVQEAPSRFFQSAAERPIGVMAPMPRDLSAEPSDVVSFFYYTDVDPALTPGRSTMSTQVPSFPPVRTSGLVPRGVLARQGLASQYEAAVEFVDLLRKQDRKVDLVTRSEVADALGESPSESSIRGKRDEMVVDFLKTQGFGE